MPADRPIFPQAAAEAAEVRLVDRLAELRQMRKNSESAVLDLRCTAVSAEADAQAVHLAAIAAGWRADSLSVQGIEDSVELPVELHADICLPPASMRQICFNNDRFFNT